MPYYQELRLQKFDPDALLHILDNTETEHRLLARGETEAFWQRLVLGDLTISVGDYRFPACIKGRIPHGQVFIGLYNYLAGEVRENYRLVSPDSLLLYAPGLERHCTSLACMGWNMLMLPVRRLQETATALYGAELEWPRQGIRHLDLHPVLAERLRQLYSGAPRNDGAWHTCVNALARLAIHVNTPPARAGGFRTLDFESIEDPIQRSVLNNMATSFSLPAEKVDALKEAGHRLLRESAEFQPLLGQLGSSD